MTSKDYRDIMRQMEREMQQLSDDVFRGFFDLPVAGSRFWNPAIDIYESDDNLVVKVELAGARAEDLHVALSPDDRTLTVGGMRREQHTERKGTVKCHQLEIYFGPFERSVQLPHGIRVDRDQLAASYRDGFLLVTLPKVEAGIATSRTIPITDDSALELNDSES